MIATTDVEIQPSVVLSTHFDCVPPFFPSRIEGDRLYGRGSCDAKGILAAQVAAVDRLPQLNRDAIRKQFERRFTARRMALDYLDAYRGLMKPAEPRIKLVSSAE